MLTLPNILTLSRILAVPLLAFLLWWPDWAFGYLLAFGLYCLMGITDYFDGLLARSSGAVSKLAKWKTTFQLVSLGALILGKGLPWWNIDIGGIDANVPHTVGLTTLWAAAILTVITGWDYLRAGLKHMD